MVFNDLELTMINQWSSLQAGHARVHTGYIRDPRPWQDRGALSFPRTAAGGPDLHKPALQCSKTKILTPSHSITLFRLSFLQKLINVKFKCVFPKQELNKKQENFEVRNFTEIPTNWNNHCDNSNSN